MTQSSPQLMRRVTSWIWDAAPWMKWIGHLDPFRSRNHRHDKQLLNYDNGVAERFNRTLKEQAIHGRIFGNLEEVRAAAVEFKDRYNRHWRLEKLGFMSPHEARHAATMKEAA